MTGHAGGVPRGALHHVELRVADLDGGPDHHAAFLEDAERIKVELVATIL